MSIQPKRLTNILVCIPSSFKCILRREFHLLRGSSLMRECRAPRKLLYHILDAMLLQTHEYIQKKSCFEISPKVTLRCGLSSHDWNRGLSRPSFGNAYHTLWSSHQTAFIFIRVWFCCSFIVRVSPSLPYYHVSLNFLSCANRRVFSFRSGYYRRASLSRLRYTRGYLRSFWGSGILRTTWQRLFTFIFWLLSTSD